MSPSDRLSLPAVAEQVAAALQESADLLQQLAHGMAQRRTAWISARSSTLQEPTDALAGLAQRIAAGAQRLQDLFAAAHALLPTPLAANPRLHVDSSLLAQHVAPALGTRLQKAGAAARDAARRVRVEHALGERLLRFSRHAHESLMANVAATLATTAFDVGGYDRGARRVTGALGTPSTPGSLIDGRA